MLHANKEKVRVFCTRSSFLKQSSRYQVLIIAPANNKKREVRHFANKFWYC